MKGGAGKTSLTICLASHFYLNGTKAAIIDADPQGSCSQWKPSKNALAHMQVEEALDEAALRRAIQHLSSGHEFVFLDTEGARTELMLDACLQADAVLIPTKADNNSRRESIITAGYVAEVAESTERGGRPLPVWGILVDVAPNTVLRRHARDKLVERGLALFEAELPHRIVYQEFADTHRAPMLDRPSGPAARDVEAIATELLDKLGQQRVPAAKVMTRRRHSAA
jgi:chromosome partitioning protein